MARHRSRIGKDNRPRDIARPAPQLPVDEVRNPPKENPHWGKDRCIIRHRPPIHPIFSCPQKESKEGPNDSAMTRHSSNSPIPESDDTDRISYRFSPIIKETVTQASTDQDTYHRIKK